MRGRAAHPRIYRVPPPPPPGVRCNVIFERAKFNRRRQEKGETVDTFIIALHTLAEHCNFGTLTDEMIRDRIVVGLLDAKLSEKLQLERP